MNEKNGRDIREELMIAQAKFIFIVILSANNIFKGRCIIRFMFGRTIEREVINGIVENIENRGPCCYLTLSSIDDSPWRLVKINFYRELSERYLKKPVSVIAESYGFLFQKLRQEISSCDMRDFVEISSSEVMKIRRAMV